MRLNRDRMEASFLGLAIGDALGAPVEFWARGSFPPVTGYRRGGFFDVAPGEWTDDTAMALCLARSLLECGKFDHRDQLERYLRWLERGEMSCRGKALGVGKTILRTLIRYRRTGRVYTDIDHERFSGNGSIMRLAPVAIFYADDVEKAVHYAALSSKTTHGSPIAVDACRLMAYILVQLYNGMGTKRLFSADFTDELTTFFSSEPLHPALQPIVEQHFRDKEAEHIKSTGYAVDTLEAALWSLHRTESFRDALLTAVNLGNDADTVGAVTGQLAGALYGRHAIPKAWEKTLCDSDTIRRIAETLAAHAIQSSEESL